MSDAHYTVFDANTFGPDEVVFGGRWSFLPLAIYDTNPELRKTVKI